jgi:hypothetical protein
MVRWHERKGLVLSLAGNVLLAGVLLWLAATRGSAPATTNTTAAPSAAGASSTPAWNQVRASDYGEYARNLRALGWPEASIVDLIVGEVTATFAQRWQSESAAVLGKYWESATPAAAAEQARLRQLRQRLERERRELLQRALGPQVLDGMGKYRLWNDVAADAELLAFLPASKRQQLAAINERYAQLEPQDPALMTQDDVRRAEANEARQRAEIAAALSPQELEELDLRKSATAQRLRDELRGFRATEAEFRQLFRVRRAYEATLATNTDVRDPNVPEVRIAAERRFAEEARAALGEQRYADYQRARDLDYQNALQVTQFFSLPDDIATRVYELKREVDARANEITANTALSEQRQRELLTQMQNDTERTLQNLLGKDVLAEYRRNNRWWIWSD